MPNVTEKNKSTILIVDDNPVTVRTLQAILEKNGYLSITAGNAAECFEKARKLTPDLILLDIHMPEMDGLDVCKVLKKEYLTEDIPIIFVTASTDDETLRNAFEIGGSDYVRKPVNKIELLARIKSVLTQREITKRILEEEKLRGIIEMAAAVCHELNQPLMGLTGTAELMLMDLSEDNPFYSNIKKIKELAERMGKITHKVLSITNYETKDYPQGKIVDIDKASSGG